MGTGPDLTDMPKEFFRLCHHLNGEAFDARRLKKYQVRLYRSGAEISW